nr:7-methylguanosine phosphate-specific 5'-nucleotidase [Leptinotarsa decemlineata]
MKNYVKQIVELTKSNVYIRDPDKVNETIERLIDGGCDKLQVVSDFDKTITKQHENGKIYASSFAMFSKCPSVTQEHIRIKDDLTKKYAPIEVDPHIPLEEKTKLMQEWWSLSEDSLKGLKVSTEEIGKVCALLCPSLRTGTNEFFKKLHEANVPVLVFSAGLGDTVVAVLKHCEVLLPNVEVVSNFLKYDNDGKILGFRNDLIHVFNKNEFAIKGTQFYNKVANRNNVILLGDSLGDATMAEGMEHLETVLKIGFLYERSEEALPSYMETFDIVLRDDQTMDVPKAIFNIIAVPNAGSELGSK